MTEDQFPGITRPKRNQRRSHAKPLSQIPDLSLVIDQRWVAAVPAAPPIERVKTYYQIMVDGSIWGLEQNPVSLSNTNFIINSPLEPLPIPTRHIYETNDDGSIKKLGTIKNYDHGFLINQIPIPTLGRIIYNSHKAI